MRKVVIMILLIFNVLNTFCQVQEEMIDKMIELANNNKGEEAKIIAIDLLNLKYGAINNESNFFAQYSISDYYYGKRKYKIGLHYFNNLLEFAEKNELTIQDKKQLLKDIKSKINDLKDFLPDDSTSDESVLAEIKRNSNTDINLTQTTISNKTSDTKLVNGNMASDNSTIQADKTETNTDKTVTLTVSGTGKTIEEARLNAMRSAIEQAFGAFISSKTEILNDNLVKDEIVSVANGNIQKYEVISQIELPNIGYGITINATVSIDKLTSFAESKGVVVEFKGGMFGATIKLQKLNEEAEVNTIYSMIGMLHENMQLSFDYIINALEPKSKDAENKFWEIPISIDVIPNSNMKNCAEYLINTLKGISLNQVEVENYKTLNKSVFPVEISFNGLKTIINLRKQISNSILLSFARNFDFYTKSFEIQTMFPDINNKIYDEKLNAEPFYYSKNYDEKILEKISFPSINKRYAKYNYTDLRSLSELEKIDKYTIIPKVKSKFKEGGYVIFETSDGHGLVCSLTSMVGNFNFYEGETIAKEANFANYKDWYIPNKEEFKLLNKELDSKRLIEVNYFWTYSCWNQITSTEHFENITNCKLLPFAWRAKNTSAGNRLSDDMYCPKDEYKNTVRLVRKF